jgi:hypothetical protein
LPQGRKDPLFQWHEDTFDLPSAGKLIATSNSVPHQAFRYGENAYGLQFHLEVTKEMIHEWVRAYKDEFDESQAPLVPKLKILCETEKKVGDYQKRGISFFREFFKHSQERG